MFLAGIHDMQWHALTIISVLIRRFQLKRAGMTLTEQCY